MASTLDPTDKPAAPAAKGNGAAPSTNGAAANGKGATSSGNGAAVAKPRASAGNGAEALPADKPAVPGKPRLAPAAKEHSVAVRAGLFVIGAIAATALVLVILGNAHSLFNRKVHYVVFFRDVDGLMVDSPVRLGGLSVGSVEAITFSPDMKDTRVQVRLQVTDSFTARIRSDSIARVASRGLLGDKTVDISLGSDDGAAVEPGGELVGGAGSDLTSVLKSGGEVVDNIVAISDDLKKAIAVYTSPKTRTEVTGALASLNAILTEVAQGKGALHNVIYDPQIGADLSSLVAGATRTAQRLDAAVTKADSMLEEVHSGNGTMHSLLYGPEGKQVLTELGGAAASVSMLIADVKSSKNAAAHELLYGESKALVDDLSASATNLKNITARIDRGEGTLGALVNDPSAYEDLKTILGNVKRNRLLRELVRFTVSNRGEFADTGKPLAPAPPEVPAAPPAPAAPVPVPSPSPAAPAVPQATR